MDLQICVEIKTVYFKQSDFDLLDQNEWYVLERGINRAGGEGNRGLKAPPNQKFPPGAEFFLIFPESFCSLSFPKVFLSISVLQKPH